MGLFGSDVMRLAEQGLDAAWYKQKVISHNIANLDTPDFKAKTANFALVLDEKCKCAYHPGKHKDRYAELKVATTYETNTNQILDGNNVDYEKESLALADTQYQYSAMIDAMNAQYMMIRSALTRV